MAEDNPNNNNTNFNPFSLPHGQDFKKIFESWFEISKTPTVGPFYAFSKDLEFYNKELTALIHAFSEIKSNMDSYMALLASTYFEASTKTAEKSPKQFLSKDDFDNYRKAMIDAFENSFTKMYDSKDFAVVYGKLLSSQLDMFKTLQSIADKNLKSLNLPTRGELDEILQDIHELKKSVRELKQKQQEISENGKTTNITQ